jgi:lysozyme family protein
MSLTERSRFSWCVGRILEREGGLVNDPNDPGGVTNWGITQRDHPLLDIAHLTRDEAIAVYKVEYWDACGAAKVPKPIDLYLFDAAVNQGVGRAVRMLQIAVGTVADGILGPVTLEAITRTGVNEAAARFMVQRTVHYLSLSTFPTFGRGWLKRLFLIAGGA